MPTFSPAGARLLIVDDESALMQALCNTLAQQGYRTVGCVGADEALQQLRTDRFDLLLTDLMMPLTDGLALARAALAIDPQMAVVMMTGQGSIATAVEAMQSGVLDYVLKPFKLAAMLPVLERALAIGRLRSENAALHERVRQHALELENANRELEAYAAAVSHDLRAPLRSIDGLTKLLSHKLGGALTQDTRYVLDLIGNCAHRGQRLVEDLLRLSRVSRQPLARSEVDVAELAREVAAELQAESAAKPAVAVAVGETWPVAQADPALLRQVFVNLLGNAFKFSQRSPQARVEVCCHTREGECVYCVADNGPGFEMSGAEDLFKPFERLQGAEDFEGSGVGLSIVQRIVQRHGGRIWAEASPGQGARFYFTLAEAPSQAAA
ncbi:MAG TPA: ATP-binding protein [Ideonella sp.]|nr:ATP-binding protein [Ideonella sp.]